MFGVEIIRRRSFRGTHAVLYPTRILTANAKNGTIYQRSLNVTLFSGFYSPELFHSLNRELYREIYMGVFMSSEWCTRCTPNKPETGPLWAQADRYYQGNIGKEADCVSMLSLSCQYYKFGGGLGVWIGPRLPRLPSLMRRERLARHPSYHSCGWTAKQVAPTQYRASSGLIGTLTPRITRY